MKKPPLWSQLPVRLRMYSLISLSVIGLALLALFMFTQLLASNTRGMEKETTHRILTIIKLSIQNEMEQTQTLARDWGAWDLMLQFSNSPDPDFIGSNLSPDTFESAHLDLGLVMDESNQVLFAYKKSPTGQENATLDVPNEETLHSLVDWVKSTSHEQQKTGFIAVDGETALVVMMPITSTDGSAPAHGVLLVGRLLDAKALLLLSQTIDQPGSVSLETETNLPAGLENIGDGLFIYETASGDNQGFVRFPADFGEELIIKVLVPNTISPQMTSLQILSMGLLGIFILATGAMLILVIDRTFLGRLSRLSKTIDADSAPDHLNEKPNGDEISRLQNYLQAAEEEKKTNWEMIDRMLALNLAEGQFNQVLNEISQIAATTLDYQTILQVLADRLGESMKADGCFVTLWDSAKQTALPGAAYGPYRETYRQAQFDPGDKTVTSAVLEKRKTLVISDTHKSPYISGSIAARLPWKSLIGVPMFVEDRPLGAVLIGYNDTHPFDSEEVQRTEKLVGPLALIISKALLYEDVQRSHAELKAAYDDTLEGWSKAIDLRDNEVEGHTRRVTSLAVRLAKHMGMPSDEIEHLRRGAILHDVGKLGVSDKILRKPGKYEPEEFEEMKLHTQYGKKFLEEIEFLRPAAVVAYTHHEKWDGSGYPQGLGAEEIPLAGRVFAIVDVWDALTQERYYKKAWTNEAALKHIQSESGKQFDPRVVEAFCEMIKEDESQKSETGRCDPV